MADKKYKPIIIHKSKDNQYYFTIVALNGRILCTSETYKRINSALRGCASVIHNILSVKGEGIHQYVNDKTKRDEKDTN